MNKIKIIWDIQNCGVPQDVKVEDVGRNIVAYLEKDTKQKWDVLEIVAYDDLLNVQQKIIEGFSSTGMTLAHAPEKLAISTALYDFTMDHRDIPVMLISSDADFAPALLTIRQKGVHVILACDQTAPRCLKNSASHVYEWCNVVRGISDDIEKDLVKVLGQYGGKLLLTELVDKYKEVHKKELNLKHHQAEDIYSLVQSMTKLDLV